MKSEEAPDIHALTRNTFFKSDSEQPTSSHFPHPIISNRIMERAEVK